MMEENGEKCKTTLNFHMWLLFKVKACILFGLVAITFASYFTHHITYAHQQINKINVLCSFRNKSFSKRLLHTHYFQIQVFSNRLVSHSVSLPIAFIHWLIPLTMIEGTSLNSLPETISMSYILHGHSSNQRETTTL